VVAIGWAANVRIMEQLRAERGGANRQDLGTERERHGSYRAGPNSMQDSAVRGEWRLTRGTKKIR
jgi:hypothetical protein